jgi:hypothetical protein
MFSDRYFLMIFSIAAVFYQNKQTFRQNSILRNLKGSIKNLVIYISDIQYYNSINAIGLIRFITSGS